MVLPSDEPWSLRKRNIQVFKTVTLNRSVEFKLRKINLPIPNTTKRKTNLAIANTAKTKMNLPIPSTAKRKINLPIPNTAKRKD